MKKKKTAHKNIGDSFDSFLKSEGILEHVENAADIKIAEQRLREIEEGKVETISIEELEARLGDPAEE